MLSAPTIRAFPRLRVNRLRADRLWVNRIRVNRIRADRFRVPHPRRRAAGWGIAHSATALLLVAGASLLHAQSAPCGLTSMTETSHPVYPPIARAAHVSGTVILLARFGQDGTATGATVVSGPPMLKGAAVDFVKGWRANAYTGPRECPIAVTFSLAGAPSAECGTPEDESQHPSAPPLRVDAQHFVITSHSPCFTVMRDPAGHRVHSFLGHRWYSKS